MALMRLGCPLHHRAQGEGFGAIYKGENYMISGAYLSSQGMYLRSLPGYLILWVCLNADPITLSVGAAHQHLKDEQRHGAHGAHHNDDGGKSTKGHTRKDSVEAQSSCALGMCR
jgi:hypothetical protein